MSRSKKAIEERTAAVLAFLYAYIGLNGVAPTLAEIAESVGCSPSSSLWHTRRLRDLGKITFEDGRQRSIRMVVRKRGRPRKSIR